MLDGVQHMLPAKDPHGRVIETILDDAISRDLVGASFPGRTPPYHYEPCDADQENKPLNSLKCMHRCDHEVDDERDKTPSPVPCPGSMAVLFCSVGFQDSF